MKNKIKERKTKKRQTLEEILSSIDPTEIEKYKKEMDYFINMKPVGNEII